MDFIGRTTAASTHKAENGLVNETKLRHESECTRQCRRKWIGGVPFARAAIGFGRCPRVVSEQRFIVPPSFGFAVVLPDGRPRVARGIYGSTRPHGPRGTARTGGSLRTLVAH